MAVKLLVLDVDATLINSPDTESVSDNVSSALRAAKKKGVDVTLATGRNYGLVSGIVEKHDIYGPCICCNGAVVLDKARVYYENALLPETVFQCLRFAEERNLSVALMNDYKMYHIIPSAVKSSIDAEGDERENIIACSYGDFTKLQPGNIYSIAVTTESILVMEQMINELRELEVSGWLKQRLEIDIGQSNSYINNAVITAKGITKGSALTNVASKLYGVTKKEIMAIGDSGVDVSLLNAAGIRIAMGNAAQAVKDVADYVVGTVQDDGVAEAIERFILA